MWQNVQFDFIRTLYDRSSISVRMGHLRSPKVPFERKEVYVKAVHCLPYCYHSVFINDILPEPRERLLCWEAKVEGLMFAGEMLVGHAKCGVMLFGAARENANDLKRERMDSSKKPIEVVEEYTYLPRSEDYSRFE